MKPVLLIDFGSTYTKVVAVDIQTEKILGSAMAFTTINTDISEGLQNAISNLEKITGKITYENRFACSSAAGGLKMVTVGLVPDLTAEAAKRAALSAGAKISGVYSFELNEEEISEIQSLQPDIILLAGGTDGGNKNTILHNAEKLAGVKGDFPVVVAGNKSVAFEVKKILSAAGKDVKVCKNVMPEFGKLNIEPTRETIRNIFLQRIIRAKGLTKVQQLIEGILMPTPSAVMKAVQILSTGYENQIGVGDVLAIDVGGATTDVYSISDGNPTRTGVIVKGLPEPFAKRTVEGDLGVRYGAEHMADVYGIENIAKVSSLSIEETQHCLQKIKVNPELLPKDSDTLTMLDFGLSSMAVKEAVIRHVGIIEKSYTPTGLTYVQTGKDLTDVKIIIGTGGAVINSDRSSDIIQNAMYDSAQPSVLKPSKADVYIDVSYILSAMGVLADKYPETAVKIIKRELGMIL